MTDIRLGLAVTHVDVPQRRIWLNQIISKLGGLDTIRRETVGWNVVTDYKHAGCWPTVKRTIVTAAVSGNPTHIIPLADDMMPCRDFLRHVKAVIRQKPDSIISLFSMRSIVREVLSRGDHWFTSNGCTIWGGSYILPVSLINDFLDWESKYIDNDIVGVHDDSRLTLYTRFHNLDVWNTAPSLVEHVGASTSLLNHANATRIASTYLDNWDGDPGNWEVGPNKLLRSASSGYIKSSLKMWDILKTRRGTNNA